MSDEKEKPGELGVAGGIGILAMLAGAPILMSRMGEEQHTVCADCDEWRPDHGGLCASTRANHNTSADGSWGPLATSFDGPLWPGCRGFKLRPGAPGPAKRYTDALKEKLTKRIIPADQSAFPKEEKP